VEIIYIGSEADAVARQVQVGVYSPVTL